MDRERCRRMPNPDPLPSPLGTHVTPGAQPGLGPARSLPSGDESGGRARTPVSSRDVPTFRDAHDRERRSVRQFVSAAADRRSCAYASPRLDGRARARRREALPLRPTQTFDGGLVATPSPPAPSTSSRPSSAGRSDLRSPRDDRASSASEATCSPIPNRQRAYSRETAVQSEAKPVRTLNLDRHVHRGADRDRPRFPHLYFFSPDPPICCWADLEVIT